MDEFEELKKFIEKEYEGRLEYLQNQKDRRLIVAMLVNAYTKGKNEGLREAIKIQEKRAA